ncbi:uncharacterized protein LOC115084693 isoform X2 [Rhinatrema bivittatum]|uniref:uncharacterized protein LOC115084693 isoform X2 n=1 Tax=Rhinatrema bivittatum TaxID=194408 RepID=UPI00112DB820|nr:uncharacterized protein LOC115084693 isoform X2 [Rhinatrema bivittatum]
MTFLTIIIQMKTKKILKGQISKRKRKDSDILTEREPKEDQEQPKKSDERPYKKPKDKHNSWLAPPVYGDQPLCHHWYGAHPISAYRSNLRMGDYQVEEQHLLSDAG